MRLGPEAAKRADRAVHVLAAAGDRIGGVDVDQSLAWHAFMPAFGKDSLNLDNHTIPHTLLFDAVETTNLPKQLEFQKNECAVRELLRTSAEPFKLKRFELLHRKHLQHRLVYCAERAKIALSGAEPAKLCKVPLDYIEKGLILDAKKEHMDSAVFRLVRRVEMLSKECMSKAGISPKMAFVTGGMAHSHQVLAAVREAAGVGVEILTGNMLGSVGNGLALAAQRRLAAP